MNNQEITRLVGTAIENGLEAHDLLHDIAEAILNLGICPDCGGSGNIMGDTKLYHLDQCVPHICPTCKGTGGEKLLKTKEDCDKCHGIRSVKK